MRRIVRALVAVGVGLSVAETGCKTVTYSVSRADLESAAAIAASAPDTRIRAVRNHAAVVGLRADDVKRGTVIGSGASDTVFIEYQDARDAVWGTGLGLVVPGLVLLPFALVKASPYLLNGAEWHVSVPVTVGAVIFGGLIMVIWGSHAESPLPAVTPY